MVLRRHAGFKVYREIKLDAYRTIYTCLTEGIGFYRFRCLFEPLKKTFIFILFRVIVTDTITVWNPDHFWDGYRSPKISQPDYRDAPGLKKHILQT